MLRICVAVSLATTHALPLLPHVLNTASTPSLRRFEIEPSGNFAPVQSVPASTVELIAPVALSHRFRWTKNETIGGDGEMASGEMASMFKEKVHGSVQKASDVSGHGQRFSAESGMLTEMPSPTQLLLLSKSTGRGGHVMYVKDSLQQLQGAKLIEMEREKPLDWVILGIFTLFLIVVDYIFIQAWEDSFRTRMLCGIFWVVSGVCFVIFVWARMSGAAAAMWLNGYYIEYALSFDNLLVYAQIFKSFRTPEADLHKALFAGIWCCMVSRFFFFVALDAALEAFHWVHYILGLVLVGCAISGHWDGDDGDNDVAAIQKTFTVRFLKLAMGGFLHEDYDRERHRLIVFIDGWPRATMLLLVVLVIEMSDFITALDSTSTKAVVMPSAYIAYSSSLMGTLGLRSLYFVLQQSLEQFSLLKYGIVIALVFAGLTLFFQDIVKIERWVVCVVVSSTLMLSVIASKLWDMRPSMTPLEVTAEDDVAENYIKDDIAEVDIAAENCIKDDIVEVDIAKPEEDQVLGVPEAHQHEGIEVGA